MATKTTKETAAERGAKTPEDHQDPAEVPFEEIDGAELLKPFSKIKGSDQGRLLGALKNLGVFNANADETDEEDPDIDFNDLDLDQVADLIDFVSAKFAKNPEKFDEWSCGDNGFERALNLAVGYASQLGK